MSFGCSKELSHREGSFEYPTHMFSLRNKKNNFLLRILICGPGMCRLIKSEHGKRQLTQSKSNSLPLEMICSCLELHDLCILTLLMPLKLSYSPNMAICVDYDPTA